MKSETRAVLGVPGRLTVGGREFSIPPPTPADMARVADRMRELAAASCVSPLQYVNANAAGLTPAVLAESVRAAVAQGSGGGVEPTREAVARQYGTLEGVRFQLWFFARRADKSLTREAVAELVTEDDVYDVADALYAALQLPEDAGPKA